MRIQMRWCVFCSLMIVIFYSFNATALIQISTVEDFQKIGNDPNFPQEEQYELTQDIDASVTRNWNEGKGFEPLKRLKGGFDGKGFKISNLYINRTDEEDVAAPFSNSDVGVEIKNLYLENVDIIGKTAVSGFIFLNRGKISNCHVTGSVSGIESVGGMIVSNAGVVENSTSSATVRGSDYVSGFVVYSGNEDLGEGVIINSTCSGNVYGNTMVGGFILLNSNLGTISNCNYSGNIFGKKELGGFVFINYNKINNCFTTAVISFRTDLEGDNSEVGGFVYINCGTIENSYSRATFKNTENATHISGFASFNGSPEAGMGKIKGCNFEGDVSGKECISGFVDYNAVGFIENSYCKGTVKANEGVGGFCFINSANISYCYSESNIECSGNYAGGFSVGNLGNINDCYSTGSVNTLGGAVNGLGGIGGFVGQTFGGTIKNCYAVGFVKGQSNFVGGFIGYLEKTSVISCYWDTETSSQINSVAGEPKTTAEMKKKETFVDWDFNTVWGIVEGKTYPYLQWSGTPLIEGEADGEAHEGEGTTEGEAYEGEGTTEGEAYEGEGTTEGEAHEGEVVPDKPNVGQIIGIVALVTFVIIFVLSLFSNIGDFIRKFLEKLFPFLFQKEEWY
ncbi:MAG: hypothetical protein LDL53_07240 [Candidatus Hydrogenedens sp.]|nr:hypothetical protein [Candidatus Hydrogenedens sp.]